ncbi:MAG: dynamin family protein [Akkermansia sp.]|nr:dynamin family protein [Akkermansia sp.]
MKLLNEQKEQEAQKILHVLDGHLDECSKQGFRELHDSLADHRQNIGNAVRQFDSAVMIVVAVGMLKAGKSTLINLLARDENASPTGFGTDTTLRPALITMGPPGDTEGNIIIYGNRPADTAKQKECLQAILDNLRGLPLSKGIDQPRVEPLRTGALKKALCVPCGVGNDLLPQEPLLVVVKIPYHADGKMLQNGRLLLDMPGLDSANAEISLRPEKVFSDEQVAELSRFLHDKLDNQGYADELVNALRARESAVTYESLIQQCDMVLCLQSSVSPLNDKACACLNSVLDMRSQATAWVVMNRMRNQDWVTEECLEGKWAEQVQNATRVFAKIKKGTELKQSSCNLGEAYAGILEDDRNIKVPEGSTVEKQKAALREHSGFLPLEEQLLNHLDQNGTATRLQFCKQTLHQELNTCKTALSARLQTANGRLQTLQQAKTAWETAAQRLHPNQGPFTIQGNAHCLTSSLEREIDKWCKSIGENHPCMKEELIPGDELDTYLQACFSKGSELTKEFLDKLGVQEVQVEQNTNGSISHHGLGDMIGGEVCKRCIDACNEAKKGVQGVSGGAQVLEHHASSFQQLCNRSRLLNGGFNITLPAATNYANTTENRPWYWPFGVGRIKASSGIWQGDIKSMVTHYCGQIADIVQANAVGQGGNNRCTEIVNQEVANRLQPVWDEIGNHTKETEDSIACLKKEIDLLGKIMQDIDSSMKQVNQW